LVVHDAGTKADTASSTPVGNGLGLFSDVVLSLFTHELVTGYSWRCADSGGTNTDIDREISDGSLLTRRFRMRNSAGGGAGSGGGGGVSSSSFIGGAVLGGLGLAIDAAALEDPLFTQIEAEGESEGEGQGQGQGQRRSKEPPICPTSPAAAAAADTWKRPSENAIRSPSGLRFRLAPVPQQQQPVGTR
jgi:hypothetical protein